MQRLIRSFNTLTDALKDTLQEQYPDGIDTSHIKTIPTAKGDILRVIELRTADAMYLIKINSESRQEIEDFLDQDDAGGEEMEDVDTSEIGDDVVDDVEEGTDDAEEEDDDDEGDEDAEGSDDDDED